jgi:hypothetical protein
MQHIHKINIKYVDFTINRRYLRVFYDFSPVPTSLCITIFWSFPKGSEFFTTNHKICLLRHWRSESI